MHILIRVDVPIKANELGEFLDALSRRLVVEFDRGDRIAGVLNVGVGKAGREIVDDVFNDIGGVFIGVGLGNHFGIELVAPIGNGDGVASLDAAVDLQLGFRDGPAEDVPARVIYIDLI